MKQETKKFNLYKWPKGKTGQDIQDEAFRKMSVDRKIQLAFALNKLLRKIAEDSIKEQYPGANDAFVKEKLREKSQNIE